MGFHWIQVLVFTSILTGINANTSCKKTMIFKEELKNKALLNHTIKSIWADDPAHCQSQCFMEDLCISVSYDTVTKLCNMSDSDHKIHPDDFVAKENSVFWAAENDCNCPNKKKKCRYNFSEGSHQCACPSDNLHGDDCQPAYKSCKEALAKTGSNESKAYNLLIDNKVTPTYCHMSSDICGGRGWTLVMKIDGSKTKFKYGSVLWTNKESFDLEAGKTGFDKKQTKLPTYWSVPFKNICIGFKTDGQLRWLKIPYTTTSMYDVIADNKQRRFDIGRQPWLNAIPGSDLQPNCNEQGFNYNGRVRIGIEGNNENECKSNDSGIGVGMSYGACGNRYGGRMRKTSFGYIFIK